MSVRPIITAPDPLLRLVSEPVAEVNDEIRALMDDMLDSMYAADGIGLAAIQIGVAKRVIVMDLSGDNDPPAPRYFVNPQILEHGAGLQACEEGCLSVPDMREMVERPDRALIGYLDYDGKQVTEWAEDIYAVCIQHEMDHLQGILFIDHLSRLKRDMALAKLRKRKQRATA